MIATIFVSEQLNISIGNINSESEEKISISVASNNWNRLVN